MYWCQYEFIYSLNSLLLCFVHMWFVFYMNSMLIWIHHVYMNLFLYWIHLCSVTYACDSILYEFNACMYSSNYICFFLISFILWIHLGVDTMAPKDAKKRMKAEKNKKQKLQTTTDPTPPKTVSNCAPSLKCKCSMQIKIFCGANNLF